MLKQIRHTVNNMSGLGFTGEEVGTHSIRASLAMALYLSKRAISTIMLLGRWSSDAFLLYVRRQVQEFSAGVSADMVSNEKNLRYRILTSRMTQTHGHGIAGHLQIRSR